MKENIEKLNIEFKKVVGIDFFPTENYQIGPSAITFNIENSTSVSKIGKLLKEINDIYELLINEENRKLNISFILKNSNEILNLHNLEYNSIDLGKFYTEEPGNRRFVLGIGYFDKKFPQFKTQNFEDIIMINGYTKK